MAISLQKGGRVDLSKESTASVFRIGFGLGRSTTW